jgi:hypothetical protein
MKGGCEPPRRALRRCCSAPTAATAAVAVEPNLAYTCCVSLVAGDGECHVAGPRCHTLWADGCLGLYLCDPIGHFY